MLGQMNLSAGLNKPLFESPAKMQHEPAQLVDFKGFGLDFDEINEGADHGMKDQTAASLKQNKKTEKLRKDLEKLMLGTDANIMRKP